MLKRLAAIVVLGGLGVWACPISAAHAAKLRNGHIAYSQSYCETFSLDCPARVWIIRPDGGGDRQLPCSAPVQGRCFDGSPAFSPDGLRLATGTLGSTPRDFIAIRSAAGKVLRRVRQRVGVSDLAWQASGQGLFVNDEADRIETLRLRGEARTVLGNSRGATDVAASREGRVAWSSEGRAGLWITNHARTRVRRLRAPADFPEWAPDGRWLAYRFGPAVITIKPDGSARRRLSRACNDADSRIAWSPDGREIACSTALGDLVTTNVRTRRARTIKARMGGVDDIDWQPKPQSQR